MTILRRCLITLSVAVLLATPVAAQDTQFGLRSPGTPARRESVRARGTAGAFAPFDALSWMTDAVLMELRRLTASAQGTSSFRRVELGTAPAADLRDTRFGSFLVGAPPAGTSKIVIGVGFGAFLDRTYHTIVRDSMSIRGAMEAFTDEIASDGGVTDIRLAAGWRPVSRLALGAGLHLLSGATRATAARHFDDSTTYSAAFEVTDVQHTGAGVSGGLLLDVTSSLRLAGWVRTDTELKVSVEDRETARYDLPTSFGGALRWIIAPELRVAGSVSSTSWSDAGGRNTTEWAVGLEGGSPAFPARIGVRGATLPFAPAGLEPTELGFAFGFGRSFSQNRTRIDVAIERLTREGGDLRESAWSLSLGFTLQP